jgi:NADH-quinone oxidoreductase subunit L
MVAVTWLVVAAPLLASAVGLLAGHRWRPLAAPLAVTGTALASVFAAVVVAGRPWRPGEAITTSLGTVPTGLVDISASLRADGLAAVVALMVGVVALVVQVYSTAYLADDDRYSSYAALVSLFTAAMLLVVLADDLFVLLVGWEVMGVCSYFLIGHHWERADARPAAVKAFLVTRVGDVGFLFGIFVLGLALGSFSITAANVRPAELTPTQLTVATLLLLCGVVGKSAQFPLHVWLPDAMAGPTPISALIHAATMVAAGVYLVTRLFPVFAAAPDTLAVLAVIAAVTMLGAALAALAQDDIKRVLAWSTVSQLAIMFGALAVAAPASAIFHLLTHAAFKALLFLAAGAVIHVVGSNLMSEMGGLRRHTSTAFWTMTIGLGALAGGPPLAGFFSKESVLTAAEHAAAGEAPVPAWTGWLLVVAGFATVAATAAYSMRLWLRTFFGPARSDIEPHATPAAMRWSLIGLAVPTVGLGVIGLTSSWLPTWLGLADQGPLTPSALTTALSLLLTALGAMGMYGVWRREPAADPARALGPAQRVFDQGFYVDAAYLAVVARPVVALARSVVRVDDGVVDAAVEGTGSGARRLGGALRLTQNGNLQGYLTGLLVGVVAVAVSVAVVLT